MSVYHPFPLRMDTAGPNSGDAITTNVQYDACFQIGEFPSPAFPDAGLPARKGNSVVILIPLKADQDPTGPGGRFINALSNKIPNILGAQPDFLLGYPDVPAATGADWGLANIVEVNRPFYTWLTPEVPNVALDPPQTRVVVMSEPIKIAQGDLSNIQRLPITPPEDAIHEIGSVAYHAAPPRNGCTPTAATSRVVIPNWVASPDDNKHQKGVAETIFMSITWGVIGIVLLIGIYFGLKAAMGPLGVWFGKIGESMAAGMTGLRRSLPTTAPGPNGTRRRLGRLLGVGSNFSRRMPPRARTPTPDSPIIDSVADRRPAIPLVPNGTFSVTNPGYASRSSTSSTSSTGLTAAEIAERRTARPRSSSWSSPTPNSMGRRLGKLFGVGPKFTRRAARAKAPTPVSPIIDKVADRGSTIPLIPNGDFMVTNPGYRTGFPKRTTTARAPRPAAPRPEPRTPPKDDSGPRRRIRSEESQRRMADARSNQLVTSTGTGLLTRDQLMQTKARKTISEAAAAKAREMAAARARRERDRIEAKINDDDDAPAPAPARRNSSSALPSWLTPSPLLASEQERSRRLDGRRGGKRGRKAGKAGKARKARNARKTGRK